MGGLDSYGNPLGSMEVFDSRTKVISKVIDDQNNWVQIPIVNMAASGFHICALPMIDKNAFILSGGYL